MINWKVYRRLPWSCKSPMPYNVHAVYNAFKQGWSDYGQLAEQLPIDLFYWLKTHLVRKNNYFKM